MKPSFWQLVREWICNHFGHSERGRPWRSYGGDKKVVDTCRRCGFIVPVTDPLVLGRFNLDEFWRNLEDGKADPLTKEELAEKAKIVPFKSPTHHEEVT